MLPAWLPKPLVSFGELSWLAVYEWLYSVGLMGCVWPRTPARRGKLTQTGACSIPPPLAYLTKAGYHHDVALSGKGVIGTLPLQMLPAAPGFHLVPRLGSAKSANMKPRQVACRKPSSGAKPWAPWQLLQSAACVPKTLPPG